MPVTLPYNALIRLTDLNVQGERNLNPINGYRVSSGSTLLLVANTSGVTNGSSISINGMSGLTSGTYTVSAVNDTDKTISIPVVPAWGIAGVRAFRINGTFYNTYILYGTNSIKAGDTVTLNTSGTAWLLSGVRTVFASTDTTITVTATGQNVNNYPELASSPYNTPPVSGTATLTATQGTSFRSTGIDNSHWSQRSGQNSLWLSDHNRQPLDTTFEEIEYGERAADGTMRKQHIASKRNFSVQWNLLPADAGYTVDGFAGGEELRQMYINNAGEFTMEVYHRGKANKLSQTPEHSIRVRIREFSYSIEKRGVQYSPGQITDFWNVDLVLEEI